MLIDPMKFLVKPTKLLSLQKNLVCNIQRFNQLMKSFVDPTNYFFNQSNFLKCPSGLKNLLITKSNS